ncbi:MAG: 50S ribosomal protein L9 [Phycisphaerales bacterium]|nr:50S ribosomal protein L9 [Phycisphaerales bacterium]
MNKNVKLLLTDNVEALGIVGDVVNVRTGYARNFLLPRNLATQPSEEKIKALAAKRAEAEKQIAAQRKQREQLSEKLQGVEIHLTKSCNDQGILYGAITQQDIAAELNKMGHAVKPRDVRLTQAIKRIDSYDVHVKLDNDLDSTLKLWVVSDRPLDLKKDQPSEAAASVHAAPAPTEGSSTEAAPADGKKKARKEGEEAKAENKPKSGFGSGPSEKPAGFDAPRPRREGRDGKDGKKGAKSR